MNHLNEFNIVTNQFSSIKISFDEEFRALLILCSFLERWNILVMAISNYISGSNKLKFDEVVGVILSKEMWRKRKGENSTSSGSALNMENKGRTREKGKGPSHDKSWGKSRKGCSQSKGKKDC